MNTKFFNEGLSRSRRNVVGSAISLTLLMLVLFAAPITSQAQSTIVGYLEL